MDRVNLLELDQAGMEAFVTQELGLSRFRADQLWQWVWQKGARDFEAMTNIAKDVRAKLAEMAELPWPEVAKTAVSTDGTVKFLLRLADGHTVETVLIPGRGRFTQCLSTQVGCAMGCTFCTTGLMGLTRNMSAGEILGQILVARAWLAEHHDWPLRNLVFMGMGEPLMNLDAVLRALGMMQTELGLSISWRRSTVSTVGIPEGLRRLGESGLALPAVSLHAPTQELRARIMPKAARTHLDELMAALDAFPLPDRERITYEYLLLGGVNDSVEHAGQLVSLLAQRRCKVNLIAYNPPPPEAGTLPYVTPAPEAVEAFAAHLRARGLTATLRRSMGRDIGAACGQLKAAEPPA